MRRNVFANTEMTPGRVSVAAGIAMMLLVCAALPARADRRSESSQQFTRAVKMRTMLEGYLEKDRSISDYKRTVEAYRKVYLISPAGDEVTTAIVAEGELYQEMGRLYDTSYYKSAVKAYRYLLSQYPTSRYCGQALRAIAGIQNTQLNEPAEAEATYKEYLRRFPHSEKTSAVRDALREVAEANGDALPALHGRRIQPRVAAKGTTTVTAIRTWDSRNAARVVVRLTNTIKYDGARISSPDRIYFDLYKAKLVRKLPEKSLAANAGLLKSVRVAQNRHGVVRVVLDVNGAKHYSAFLLANPYRLVINVPAPAGSTAPHARSAVASTPARTKSTRKNRNPFSLASADNARGLRPPAEPKPTRNGERSLSRVLGLKIRRIVIDPGHGGYDTGAIGPTGLTEKAVCLDVALRLGRLIKRNLPGAQVIYTRKTDVFVPLEKRTEIANKAKADLFISIHANSSPDPAVRGVETYYLNFTASPESMRVAARENATSHLSVYDLQNLIKKIARNDKIEESEELAEDIQDNLSQRLKRVSSRERNRGVKRAPFVVLIGAHMPSVLTEISFLSNRTDERLLREPQERERIAVGIYRGIAEYLKSLNSYAYDKGKLASNSQPPVTHLETASAVALAQNPR